MMKVCVKISTDIWIKLDHLFSYPQSILTNLFSDSQISIRFGHVVWEVHDPLKSLQLSNEQNHSEYLPSALKYGLSYDLLLNL